MFHPTKALKFHSYFGAHICQYGQKCIQKWRKQKRGQTFLPSFPPQECLLPSCECLFVITGQCPPARLFSCQHILNFLKPCQLGFEAEKILRCVSLKCFIVFPQEGQTTHPPLTQLWREMHFSTSFRSWASVKSAKFGWQRKLRIYVCWKLEGGKLSKWKTNIIFGWSDFAMNFLFDYRSMTKMGQQ